MSESEKPSFLSGLFKKKADVFKIGNETGSDVQSALKEVDRQIKQAQKGNPITGEGVTKSGEED